MPKLFISYSHLDEKFVSKFLNHLSPLKNNGFIEEWYDRKIETGQEFQDDIDNNLNNADIICLMISDNFLSSNACLEEKDIALKLRVTKGIRTIPIIISPCAWTLHKELSPILAIPTDGKPVSSFLDPNEGWLDVINWIRKVIDSIQKIKVLEVTEEFNFFLNSADILTKSHSNRETLNLEDIFVFPRLKTYDEKESSQRYDAEDLKKDVLTLGKIIIAGESQSGKTTLCKKLFKIYRELNYIPVYIEDDNKFLGNPLNKVEKTFSEQYNAKSISDYDFKRIVPILDNFHYAKHQEKYIDEFQVFEHQVFIVDDIFGLNVKSQNLIKKYHKFKIREFTAFERNEIIKKWIQITENSQIQMNPNHLQQSIDEKTELIESSLGIIFGKGIMPSYAFFILSLLAAQDIQKPLDQEITSQGYCYQALIYLYLRKEGIKNDQFDIYLNFLTELSFYIYEKGGSGLSNEDFQVFLREYTAKFNLPISPTDLVRKLTNVNICGFDSFNQFHFSYNYIYYFFVAKYLAENIDKQKFLINKIIANLHKNENAYITVFMTHHSKSSYLLDELLLNAEILFEKYSPSTLDSKELSFFDKHEDKIVQAILPSYMHNVEEERKKILYEKAQIEEDIDRPEEESETQLQKAKNRTQFKLSSSEEMEVTELLTNLRLSIKTVEVMGLIIKNRSGSLDLKRIEYIYEQGLKVHLRILSSLFEIIKDEKVEAELIDFLKDRLDQIINENEKEPKIEEIEKLARLLFWNMNFGIVLGFITKAVHSLGSVNLLKIAKVVSEKENTPSSFIAYHCINMWYGKNLKIDEIASRISKEDFSKTADRLLKIKIVEHCRLHKISINDMQQIEKKLGMRSGKLIAESTKKS
jgi:uridine kinase